MIKYVVKQFFVIDKAVTTDEEFQLYVMDKRTLAKYKDFVHKFEVKRSARLMLNNNAMLTTWVFDNRQQAEEFVNEKESYWRDKISTQSHVLYSYGPLQIEEVEYANPDYI